MDWDNETLENWDMKMENADKGLVLIDDDETELYNINNPIPSTEEINRILNELN